MVKKLLVVIGITTCILSGCLSGSTGVPQGALTGETPGGGTTPPAATADQWNGWTQVPGGRTTDVAVAPVGFNNKLYVFAKGINDNQLIYVNTFGPAGN